MPVMNEPVEGTDPWADVEDVFEGSSDGGESSAEIEAAAAAQSNADAFSALSSGYDAPGGGYTPMPTKLKGWTLGISGSITYDSNAKQSPGWPLAPIQDDWILALTPSIGYRTSRASNWYAAVNASFGWNHYFQTDPSNGYNIRAGLDLGYEGPKLDASLNLSYSYQEGYNRYFNSGLNNNFVNQQHLDLSARAAYRLSSKTSFTADLSSNAFSPSGRQYNNTQNTRFNTGMRWKATGLTSLEGGVSYSQQGGDRQFDRWTLGPYLGVDYKLAAKVKFNARVGLDFVNFDGPGILGGGGSDVFVPVNIGFTYNASALWGMMLKRLPAAILPTVRTTCSWVLMLREGMVCRATTRWLATTTGSMPPSG